MWIENGESPIKEIVNNGESKTIFISFNKYFSILRTFPFITKVYFLFVFFLENEGAKPMLKFRPFFTSLL